MGHLMGLFDAPWLGIAPTRKMAFLRYCEFNRVEDGKIVETMLHFDIAHLMMQAGQNPFAPQTAAHLVQPGRATHDGMLHDAQPADVSDATYTIERYAKQHSGPFRAAFYDRSGTGHVARLAEGQYGGFFGWPSFTAKQRGGIYGDARQ